MPTPAGVPVEITSPGCSIKPAEMVSIRVGMSKMRSPVLADCRNSPFTNVLSSRFSGSTSSEVATHGPRTERVERLAEKPLLMVLLSVPCCNVVENEITKDVFVSVGFGNVSSGLADYKCELALVIDGRSDLRMEVNDGAVSNNGARWLGEDSRKRIDIRDRPGLKSTTRKFTRMFTVILTYTKNVAPQICERRQKRDGFQGNLAGFVFVLNRLFEADDYIIHIAERRRQRGDPRNRGIENANASCSFMQKPDELHDNLRETGSRW